MYISKTFTVFMATCLARNYAQQANSTLRKCRVDFAGAVKIATPIFVATATVYCYPAKNYTYIC